jgi:ABC-2 type transport system ATP-binding protein
LVLTFASTSDAGTALELVRPLAAKSPNIEGTVIEMTVEQGPSVAIEVLRRLDGASIELAGLSLREPSLDDVFLNLTGHKAEDVPEVQPSAKKRKARK